MSRLVKRLRVLADEWDCDETDDVYHGFDDAADEIERLTEELAAARATHYEECAVLCEPQDEHFGPWYADLIRSRLPIAGGGVK